MSKSAIYTVNAAGVTVNAGSVIPLGNTIRRFGCCIRQDGNTITLCGQGYYLVNVSATITPAEAGVVTVYAQKDGVELIDAAASQSADAGGAVNLSIPAIVRNACDNSNSLLSFALDGVTAIINNIAVTIEKL